MFHKIGSIVEKAVIFCTVLSGWLHDRKAADADVFLFCWCALKQCVEHYTYLNIYTRYYVRTFAHKLCCILSAKLNVLEILFNNWYQNICKISYQCKPPNSKYCPWGHFNHLESAEASVKAITAQWLYLPVLCQAWSMYQVKDQCSVCLCITLWWKPCDQSWGYSMFNHSYKLSI